MNKEINWKNVRKVLVVRLRSIGDTVLTTPSLILLKKFLPDAQIDILLEDWVAPVLENFEYVDNVLSVSKGVKNRLSLARKIRKEKYDLAFNLHGGTTSTFFVRASGAKHRVGYKDYQYSFLSNHLLSSSSDFWGKTPTHSAEQQMALLGFVGVPVNDKQKTRLLVTTKDIEDMDLFLHVHGIEDDDEIAFIHPAAAFDTKRWSTDNFAKVIDFLGSKEIVSIILTSPNEKRLIDEISGKTDRFFQGFWDLTLPEVTTLAKRAKIFIGNDSGIAHMAAAVGTPTVVVFGSSNRDHWRPWTEAPNEIVYEDFPCQPCAGYVCEEFGEPKCILSVKNENVIAAIKKLL